MASDFVPTVARPIGSDHLSEQGVAALPNEVHPYREFDTAVKIAELRQASYDHVLTGRRDIAAFSGELDSILKEGKELNSSPESAAEKEQAMKFLRKRADAVRKTWEEISRQRHDLRPSILEGYQRAWSALLSLPVQGDVSWIERRLEDLQLESEAFYASNNEKQAYATGTDSEQIFLVNFLFQRPEEAVFVFRRFEMLIAYDAQIEGAALTEARIQRVVQDIESSPKAKGVGQMEVLHGQLMFLEGELFEEDKNLPAETDAYTQAVAILGGCAVGGSCGTDLVLAMRRLAKADRATNHTIDAVKLDKDADKLAAKLKKAEKGSH